MFELKALTLEAVPSALEKAKRYRLLNEPDEAESICRDILAAAPGHQDALITLLLATTDKFNEFGLQRLFEEAKQIVAQMDTSYCEFYYTGIIFERRAKFHFKQGGPGSGAVAYDWFAKAMQQYDQALAGCDPDNQDAILRWNSCARFMNSHPDLKSFDADQKEMLIDPYETPH